MLSSQFAKRGAQLHRHQLRSMLFLASFDRRSVPWPSVLLLPVVGVPSLRPRPARDGGALLASRAAIVAQWA